MNFNTVRERLGYSSVGELWDGTPMDIESNQGETIHIESKSPNGQFVGWNLQTGSPAILSDITKNWRKHEKERPHYMAIVKDPNCRLIRPGGYFETEQEARTHYGDKFVKLCEESIMLPGSNVFHGR